MPTNFTDLLKQALTLGAKHISPSKLPQFFGFVVYLGLVTVVWAGVSLKMEPTIIGAAIVLLVIAAIMAILLVSGATISPVVLNVLIIIVVLGFLAVGAYAVVQIVVPPGDTRIQSNLRYSDNTSARDYLITVKGSQSGVKTSEDGYFDLPVSPSTDVRKGKVALHVESGDHTRAEDTEVPVTVGTINRPGDIRLTFARTQAPLPPGPVAQPTSGHKVLLEGFTHYADAAFTFRNAYVVAWGSPISDFGVTNTNPPGPFAKLFVPYEMQPYADPKAYAGALKVNAPSLVSLKECPGEGYQFHWFDVSPDDIICLRTRDGNHYAKIRITEVTADRIGFDWVYQPDGTRTFP